MLVLLAVVISLVIYCPNGSKITDESHQDTAIQKFPASLIEAMVHVIACSLPKLDAPSTILTASAKETLHYAVHLVQENKPVPIELTKALLTGLPERVFVDKNPAELFKVLRVWINEKVNPSLFDNTSIGSLSAFVIHELSSDVNSVEKLIQSLPEEALSNQVFIEASSDLSGTIELPGVLSITGKKSRRKYILSGIVTEYKSTITKKYYPQYVWGRYMPEKKKIGEGHATIYELHTSVTYNLADRPRLIVYTEEDVAKVLTTPPVPTTGGHALLFGDRVKFGQKETHWVRKLLRSLIPSLGNEDHLRPILLALKYVFPEEIFKGDDALSNVLRRSGDGAPIDQNDIKKLRDISGGNSVLRTPSHYYESLLRMVSGSKELLAEHTVIGTESKVFCPHCEKFSCQQPKDSFVLPVSVDEQNDSSPITLSQAIFSVHQSPGLPTIPYPCNGCSKKIQHRRLTDISKYPDRLLAIEVLRNKDSSFAKQKNYRIVKCPQDNLIIGDRVYKRLIVILECTGIGKFVLWVRLPHNKWRLICHDSVIEADPTKCLENPELGGPAMLFYAKE